MYKFSSDLDICTIKPHGNAVIEFYADGLDKFQGYPSVVLAVEVAGAKVVSSRALPVRGWVKYAEVFQRVVQFIKDNDLKEAT